MITRIAFSLTAVLLLIVAWETIVYVHDLHTLPAYPLAFLAFIAIMIFGRFLMSIGNARVRARYR